MIDVIVLNNVQIRNVNVSWQGKNLKEAYDDVRTVYLSTKF